LDERAREQLRRRAARTTPSDSAVQAAACSGARVASGLAARQWSRGARMPRATLFYRPLRSRRVEPRGNRDLATEPDKRRVQLKELADRRGRGEWNTLNRAESTCIDRRKGHACHGVAAWEAAIELPTSAFPHTDRPKFPHRGVLVKRRARATTVHHYGTQRSCCDDKPPEPREQNGMTPTGPKKHTQQCWFFWCT
jgi:hypothetical protein